MKQTYTWLAASISCSKMHWDRLLNEIVLFHQEMNQPDIGSMMLQFNYQGGENIRWALLSPQEQAGNLAREIDTHFNYFLSGLPVFDNQHASADESIFPVLPGNSIHFGLYEPAKCSSIQSSLSWMMIEALAGDRIDDEAIITFAFYLQVSLIKVMLTRGFTSLETLRKLYHTDGTHTSDVTLNHECIFQIVDSIIDPSQAEERPVWLHKWMSLCEDEISKEQPFPLNKNPLLSYSRLIYQLHMHLGITVKMESILFSYTSVVINSNILEESRTNI